MKKKTPRRRKDKRMDALKILLDGKRKKEEKEGEEAKARRRSSSEEEDSTESSEAACGSSEEDLSLLPPLKKKSEKEEGSVLELLIAQIKLRLNELGGAAEHENPVLQGTRVLTYWHTLTHSGGVNAQNRDGREMFLLANCMDLLRIGRLGRLGDALAARWLALEQAGLDQNWTAARHLEIFSPDHTTAAGPAVTLAARKLSRLMDKVTAKEGRPPRGQKGGQGHIGRTRSEPWQDKGGKGKGGKDAKDEKWSNWGGRGSWGKKQWKNPWQKPKGQQNEKAEKGDKGKEE